MYLPPSLSTAGYASSKMKYIGPSGATAAIINTAITDLSAASTSYSKGTVKLDSGTYWLETAIVMKNNVRLHMEPDTILIPTFTGSADDADNSVIKIVGTLDTSYLNTTVSANVVKGKYSFAVTSAGTLTAGKYVELRGRDTTSSSHSDGPDVDYGEILLVDSSYTSGTTIPTAGPIYQGHDSGRTAKGVVPVVGAEVIGGVIRGSQGSVITAVGVQGKWAVDLLVDGLRADGMCRAAIGLNTCRKFTLSNFFSLGDNNCWFHILSCCDGDIYGFNGANDVARVRSTGIPRAHLFMRFRNVDVRVHDGTFTGGAMGGFFHGGGMGLVFNNILIRNQQCTTAIYDRWVASGEHGAGGTIGLGFGSGSGVLAQAEFAVGCTYSNITTTDLNVPNATPWSDAAPRQGCAAYIHDTKNFNLTNLSCTNWEETGQVGGVVFSDCSGAAQNITIKGHNYGISCQNVLDDVKVDRYYFDAARFASPNAGVPIFLNYDPNSNRGIKFDGVHVFNAFSFINFGGSFPGDKNFEIRDLIANYGQWDYVILGNNATATAFTAGDIVEIDPDYTGSTTILRIKSPNTGVADYTGRLAVVCSGLPDDAGTGFLLIAPLPQNRASVKATTDLVSFGDRIAYAGTRRCAKSEGANQPLGISRSYKAAGAEDYIVIGNVG